MHVKHQNKIKTQTNDCKTLGYSRCLNAGTRPQPSTPLVNRIVNDRLLHATFRFSTGAARLTPLLQEIV